MTAASVPGASRVRVAALLLVLAAVSAACGGGGEQPRLTPAGTLAAAKRQLDETSGVRIGIATKTLPRGVDGLLSAEGVGTHAPAFQGMIKVSAQGVTADAAVVAVGGDVWARLPFTTRFVAIDPADYGAPDPAGLMSRRRGLSSLLTAARRIRQGEQVRDGRQLLRSYRATVPGAAVAAVLPSASGSARFRATFTVTDRQRLSKAVLTGRFYPGEHDLAYTITLEDYGMRKRITAP